MDIDEIEQDDIEDLRSSCCICEYKDYPVLRNFLRMLRPK